MTQKPRDTFRIVSLVLCVVLAVSATAIVFSLQTAKLQNEITDLQNPKLFNINLAYTDNLQGKLNVTGYVYNAGQATAYGSMLYVRLYSNGELTNTTGVQLGNTHNVPTFGGSIPGNTSTYVDTTIPYNGASPTNVTFSLEWITEWQIPVP